MHAKGHYRQAFEDAVEAFLLWEDGAPEPTVDFGGKQTPIRRVCGLLWNCSDILPSRLAESVAECERHCPSPRRNTYGAAARFLRQEITNVTPDPMAEINGIPQEADKSAVAEA